MLGSLLQRTTAALLAGCFALASFAAPAAAAEAQTPQLPRNPTKPTEVVIIGTRHSAQLEYEDHAPARIRALLNRIAPAAVGVETSPWWYEEEVFFEIAYESYGVAVPWAQEKGKEIRPIDWQARGIEFANALAWPYVEPKAAPASADDQSSPYGSEEVPLESWDMRDLLFADAPAWRDAVNRDYAYAANDPNPASEAMRRYMLYRNLMIGREIVDMAADYEGQRVAVLIGAAHKPDLDLFLATIPNIVVRHASEWTGVTEAEVAAEERRPDHLAILWYNLASGRVEPVNLDLPRMNTLLSKLEKETPNDPEIRFLRARWHQLKGETAPAVAIYRDLAWERQWADRQFTYPDRNLAQRVHTWWNFHELLVGEPAEFGLGNVLSPIANLTIRQRVLYELALQQFDLAACERARAELTNVGLNPTQTQQLQALLDAPEPKRP